MEKVTSFTHGYSDSLKLKKVWKGVLHILASEYGPQVLDYLLQYGCASTLEIWKTLNTNRETINHHLNNLETHGLVTTYATLQDIKVIPSQYRNTKIKGWKGLTPDYSNRAIQRTIRFFKKEPEVYTDVEDRIWAFVSRERIPLSWTEIVKVIGERFPEVPVRDRGPIARRLSTRMSSSVIGGFE